MFGFQWYTTPIIIMCTGIRKKNYKICNNQFCRKIFDNKIAMPPNEENPFDWECPSRITGGLLFTPLGQKRKEKCSSVRLYWG